MNNIVTLIVGFVVNLILARFFYGLAETIWTDSPFLFQWGLVGLSIYLFGKRGLVLVRTEHVAVLEIFKKRTHVIFEEGLNWMLPAPLMSCITVDMRQFIIDPGSLDQGEEKEAEDFKLEEVLTKDNVAVGVDVYALVRVKDPYQVLNVEDPHGALHKWVERTTRIVVSRYPSMNTTEKRMVKGVEKTIKVAGVTKATKAMSKALDKQLREKIGDWGFALDDAMIRRVRLPEETEKAIKNTATLTAGEKLRERMRLARERLEIADDLDDSYDEVLKEYDDDRKNEKLSEESYNTLVRQLESERDRLRSDHLGYGKDK